MTRVSQMARSLIVIHTCILAKDVRERGGVVGREGVRVQRDVLEVELAQRPAVGFRWWFPAVYSLHQGGRGRLNTGINQSSPPLPCLEGGYQRGAGFDGSEHVARRRRREEHVRAAIQRGLGVCEFVRERNERAAGSDGSTARFWCLPAVRAPRGEQGA